MLVRSQFVSNFLQCRVLPWYRHAYKQTEYEKKWDRPLIRWTVITMRHWRVHKYRHSCASLLHKALSQHTRFYNRTKRAGTIASAFFFFFFPTFIVTQSHLFHLMFCPFFFLLLYISNKNSNRTLIWNRLVNYFYFDRFGCASNIYCLFIFSPIQQSVHFFFF